MDHSSKQGHARLQPHLRLNDRSGPVLHQLRRSRGHATRHCLHFDDDCDGFVVRDSREVPAKHPLANQHSVLRLRSDDQQ